MSPEAPVAEPQAAPTAPAPLRFTSGPWPWAVAAVAVIAAVALALAWMSMQRVRLLEEQLVARQQQSQTEATEAVVLARQSQDTAREVAAKMALLEARVAEAAVQRSQLDDLIQSLTRSRDENLLADLEAALRVAQQQSALTGSPEPVLSTLRQADERLARYNQPRLERVRRAVLRDLDRAKAAAPVDIPGLVLRLDEVIRQVDDLPLTGVPAAGGARPSAVTPPVGAAAALSRGDAAAPTPTPTGTTTSARAGEPAASAAARAPASTGAQGTGPQPPSSGEGAASWAQALGQASTWAAALLDRVWGDVRGLVRLSRIDHPEALLAAPEQVFFLRENLKLRLLNARLSLMSRQFDVAQSDLRDAQGAIERYFDGQHRRVAAAQDLLRQISLQARQVSVPRPDETLAALASTQAGR